MKKVNTDEAHYYRLLCEATAGEEIIIAKYGHPITRLVPVREDAQRTLGIDVGKGWIADDFDELTPEMLVDFCGDDPT